MLGTISQEEARAAAAVRIRHHLIDSAIRTRRAAAEQPEELVLQATAELLEELVEELREVCQ